MSVGKTEAMEYKGIRLLWNVDVSYQNSRSVIPDDDNQHIVYGYLRIYVAELHPLYGLFLYKNYIYVVTCSLYWDLNVFMWYY